MLDIKYIRENAELVKEHMERRGAKVEVDRLLEVDEKWRELSQEAESLQAQLNEANPKISAAQGDEKTALIIEMKEVSGKLKEIQGQLDPVASDRNALWRSMPNLLLDGVPDGGEEDAAVVAESDVKPREDTPADYLTLLGGSIDLERGAKVSGARFVYLKDKVARLELGLVTYIVDCLAEAGFTYVVPPVLVRGEAMGGMGYLDHDGDEIYKTQDDLYLVGTSEQSLGPMHMDEILEAAQVPLRYVAFSPCFRREAGSHGKDVHGILRLHQFDKVEMFSFADPNTSEQEHEFLLQQQRGIMDALELPYRVVLLAAKDLGAPSAKTYDIETWIPSEHTYRETHSTSNTTDYQARRLNVRVRTEAGATKAHMLNGTAAAISRLLIALIENHQRSDGSVAIPEVLHRYLPFTSIAGDAGNT